MDQNYGLLTEEQGRDIGLVKLRSQMGFTGKNEDRETVQKERKKERKKEVQNEKYRGINERRT
jgi:hypothetical protein